MNARYDKDFLAHEILPLLDRIDQQEERFNAEADDKPGELGVIRYF